MDAGLGCPDWPGCVVLLFFQCQKLRLLANELYPERQLNLKRQCRSCARYLQDF